MFGTKEQGANFKIGKGAGSRKNDNPEPRSTKNCKLEHEAQENSGKEHGARDKFKQTGFYKATLDHIFLLWSYPNKI